MEAITTADSAKCTLALQSRDAPRSSAL
jgi:hypothetical protein